jgi:hypothetical protein
MWKLKNEEEVKKIRQRKKNAYKKIWRPFSLAVLFFVVGAIQIKIGFRKYAFTTFDPITWEEFLEYGLMDAFWIALIFFVGFYLLQIVSKNLVFSGPDSMICLLCEKLKNDDKNYKCPCGGEFVPLDELEWLDEEKDCIKNADQ